MIASNSKKCTACQQDKNIQEFNKDKHRKDGLYCYCKTCARNRINNHYLRNKEKIKERHKVRYRKNRQKTLDRQAKYRSHNPELIKRRAAHTYQKYKARLRIQRRSYNRRYYMQRIAVDIQFKLIKRIRSRMNKMVSRDTKSGSSIKDLGCSVRELKIYLEIKFQPGMTWENWGIDGWHIDHIKPLSGFNLTDRQQFLAACHYSNLQPLWALDNMIKGGFKKDLKSSQSHGIMNATDEIEMNVSDGDRIKKLAQSILERKKNVQEDS